MTYIERNKNYKMSVSNNILEIPKKPATCADLASFKLKKHRFFS